MVAPKARSARRVLPDTGFWISLYSTSEKNHGRAREYLDKIRWSTILLPWPILYEVLRTKFVRDPRFVQGFRNHLEELPVSRIDDTRYREAGLRETYRWCIESERRLSLVDCVVRAMVQDRELRIDYLVTFDPGHFADVCRERRITLLGQ